MIKHKFKKNFLNIEMHHIEKYYFLKFTNKINSLVLSEVIKFSKQNTNKKFHQYGWLQLIYLIFFYVNIFWCARKSSIDFASLVSLVLHNVNRFHKSTEKTISSAQRIPQTIPQFMALFIPKRLVLIVCPQSGVKFTWRLVSADEQHYFY